MNAQIKAARDLLGMTQKELCDAASVPLITLRRIEGKLGHIGLVGSETVSRVRATLESCGIQFLCTGQVAAGPGVAIRGAT